MKIDTFYHYLFYKLFKLLQARTSSTFTWIATVFAMVALEIWAMISVIGGVGYIFGIELFSDNNIWTFLVMFAVMLLGLNMLIFSGGNRWLMRREMFDSWPATEHTKYGDVVSIAGYVLVIHTVIWVSWS